MRQTIHRLVACFLALLLIAPAFGQGSSGTRPSGFFPEPNAGQSDAAASYLLLGTSTVYSNERVFTPSAAFDVTDNGSGNTYDFDLATVTIGYGGTGATTQLGAANAILGFAGVAAGDLLRRNAANNSWELVPVGDPDDVLTIDGSNMPNWAPPGLGIGSDLSLITVSSEASLSDERVLTGTANKITVTDGGANTTITLNVGTDITQNTATQTLTNKTLTGPIMSWDSGGGFDLAGQAHTSALKWADWAGAVNITIPDPGGNAEVVLSEANQTIDGTKTFEDAPTLSTGTLTAGANLMTFPSSAQTLVGRTSTDTLTNKTLTDPNITNGTIVLKETTADYTIDWDNPSGARNLTVKDVGSDADFALKEADGVYTAGGAVYAHAGLFKVTSAGTSGHPLISGGTGAPAFNVLGIVGGGTNNTSLNVGAGRVMRGDGTKILSLAIGTAGQVLTVNSGATDVEWAAAASGGHTLEEEGTPVTVRSTLNFVGSGFTLSDISSKSTLTLDSDLNTISALTATAGDLLAVNDSGAWTDFAGSGTNGYVLTYQSGGNPNLAWAAPGTMLTASNSSGFTASYNTLHMIDTSGGAVTATLPTAASHTGEFVILSLRTAGNNLTVNTTSSQTYDGQASGSIVTGVRYNTFWFISDGSNWILM